MKLGDRVRVGAVMIRMFPSDGNDVHWNSRPLKAGVVGVFAGFRWRQNGRIQFGSCGSMGEISDEPSCFVETAKRTKVALVYFDVWKKPLIADPSSLVPVGD